MAELLPTIVTTVSTIGVITAAAWPIIKPWLERTVDKRIDYEFSTKLENHKQGLEVLTESAKYDFQKKLANVSLHTRRQHEAYTEAYRAARIAHGLLLNQRGLRQVPTFEEYNADDAEAYLQGRDAPKGFIQEIRNLWDHNREAAVRKLGPYARMLDLQTAENALIEAKNQTFVNELYFSDEVVKHANEFIEAANAVLIELKYPSDYAKWQQLTKSFNNSLEQLHDAMRKELAAS